MEPVSSAQSLSLWDSGILALILFTFMSLGLVAALLFFSSWLGEKKPNPEKTQNDPRQVKPMD